jgi:hypothetical protein
MASPSNARFRFIWNFVSVGMMGITTLGLVAGVI